MRKTNMLMCPKTKDSISSDFQICPWIFLWEKICPCSSPYFCLSVKSKSSHLPTTWSIPFYFQTCMFLVADSWIYKRLCPSVGSSVSQSVCWFVSKSWKVEKQLLKMCMSGRGGIWKPLPIHPRRYCNTSYRLVFSNNENLLYWIITPLWIRPQEEWKDHFCHCVICHQEHVGYWKNKKTNKFILNFFIYITLLVKKGYF